MSRRKGRPVSGWLVVDKPAGITSTAVVNKVRWAFGAAKAGHAGTLDPAATGVLAVALGEATKTVPYVTDWLKCYRFQVRFGQATNTDDAEGQVIAESDQRPTDAQIRDGLAAFRGAIQQVPPQFSAVKIDGQRAYALARAGEAVDIAARPLWVDRLDMVQRPDADHAELEMVCGKGGYVRSIGRDLGAALGCLGHVLWLRRTWSGPFRAEDGIDIATLEGLAGTDALDGWLQPLEVALAGMTAWDCPSGVEGPLRNGNAVPLAVPDGMGWIGQQGRALALGQVRGGMFQPDRVIVAEEGESRPTIPATGKPGFDPA
jgi:tRNA pseudouridine55 synthase